MRNLTKLVITAAIFSAPFTSATVLAIDQGDTLVRARIINIAPDVNDNQIMSEGSPLVPPAGIDVDSANKPGY